ncbi:phage fiber-tail adaptor protein [Sphingomonas sp. PR090111-T3T-6A]|uniref:phage fiber-tail adaptor protein n=1 Tax=Sphingomonas sp. PR090111-T3T-6A TaxID=685778 RepID=UPI00037CA7EA|nr:hypothetical protein [Sphingomonas sp. PR090111-T3T-6A]
MRLVTTSPGATFDYSIHWPRAALLGVPIVESDWVSVPEGLSFDPFAEERCTAARISGGEAGARYRVLNRVTLADDRTLIRALELEAGR